MGGRRGRLRADRLRQAILHGLFPIGGTVVLLIAALVAIFAPLSEGLPAAGLAGSLAPTAAGFGAALSHPSDAKAPAELGGALHLVKSEFTQRSGTEAEIDARLRAHAGELMPQLGGRAWNWDIQVTLKRQVLSRLIYWYELYQKVLPVQGVICEFGVQWGASLATLVNLRGMLEPYNHARKIYGFDTFSGFVGVEDADKGYSTAGQYTVPPAYEDRLGEILALHEGLSPLPHIRKFDLIKGDASQTVPRWLDDNSHAVIAMAIFDMDVYKPTRDVLEAILPRLTRGSVLVFDELNCQHFPGETQALREVLGLSRLALHNFPHQPYCTWAVWEG